jgi:poly(3-hydroxybutyrate) depolymerase
LVARRLFTACLNLGLHLVPLIDELFTPERTRRLAALTMDYYQQMEHEPAFHSLGSTMGGAYADLLGYGQMAGHYYLYAPHSTSPGPLPSIVFLHGSGGNFNYLIPDY